VLGSYFVYFDRIWPKLKLKEHHPYIRSRVEQEKAAIEAGGKDMSVCILELPYIFGSMPGRKPIWKPLITYIRSTPVVFYTHGGTNCISVEHIAESIAGALEKGRARASYVIGDENLTWVEMLRKISQSMGREKPIISLPNWLAIMAGAFIKLLHYLQGREGGLDPIALIKLQTAMTFFDPTPSKKDLGYRSGGLDEALKKTIIACE
jgi:hypothetical protein